MYNLNLRLTGVFIIFIFFNQNIDCEESLEPPHFHGRFSRETKINVFGKYNKCVAIFHLKMIIFPAKKTVSGFSLTQPDKQSEAKDSYLWAETPNFGQCIKISI